MSNAKPSGAPAGVKGHSIIIRLHSSRHPPVCLEAIIIARPCPPLPSTRIHEDAQRKVKRLNRESASDSFPRAFQEARVRLIFPFFLPFRVNIACPWIPQSRLARIP
jgi:hypothetical protein